MTTATQQNGVAKHIPEETASCRVIGFTGLSSFVGVVALAVVAAIAR